MVLPNAVPYDARVQPSASGRMRWWEPAAVFAGLVVLMAAWLWTPLTEPGVLITEREGQLLYHRAVRNAARLGDVALGGVPMVSVGDVPKQQRRFWTHHPPLVTLVFRAATAVTGESVYTGRWLMLLAWAATGAAVYALARRFGDPLAASLGALLVGFATGVQRDGLLVEILGGVAVFCSVLAVIAYLRWQDEPGAWRALLMFLAVGAAVLCHWQGLLVAGFIALDRWFGARRLKEVTTLLPVFGVLIAGAWMAWAHHVAAGTVPYSAGGIGEGDLFATLASRVNDGPVFVDEPRVGPLAGAVQAVDTLLFRNFQMGALGLAAAGGIAVVIVAFMRKIGPSIRGVLLVTFPPVTFLLVFSRGAMIHPFWTLSAVPGIALFAALWMAVLLPALRAELGRAVTAVIAAVIFFGVVGPEVLAGRHQWDADLPELRQGQKTLDHLERALAGRLGPEDHVIVTDHGVRYDHLAWMLDRTVHGHVGSPAAVEAIRAATGGHVVAVMQDRELLRLPKVAGHLVDYPMATIAREGVGGARGQGRPHPHGR